MPNTGASKAQVGADRGREHQHGFRRVAVEAVRGAAAGAGGDEARLKYGFLARCTGTKLGPHFEAVAGPCERLFDGDADVVLHRVAKGDARPEWTDLGDVDPAPVVAPGFLPFAIARPIDPDRMRDFTQCVVRDTARRSDARIPRLGGGPSVDLRA